ncbi:autophagy-related protein 13-domain-containing protein [Schizophyllum fasciatum]
MSNEQQKTDQIAAHLYTKLAHVVNHGRATETRAGKTDKWFNLDLPDSEVLTREDRERYKAVSIPPHPPPLELQVLLTVPPAPNQALVYAPADAPRVRVEPAPRAVVLESWVLTFVPRGELDPDLPAATTYKHGISLFRSVFSLLRLLPSWRLSKKLRRRGNGLGVQLRVKPPGPEAAGMSASGAWDGIMGMHMSPSPSSSPLASSTHTFAPIPHAAGLFSLSVTYLSAPEFSLESLESLLSSRFLSEGPDFVPTLRKNQQRDTVGGSSGSLGLGSTRAPLTKSPPRDIPLSGRSPPHTSSPLARSPPRQAAPLPRSRTSSLASASASLRSHADPPSLAARLRRESGTGRASPDSPYSARAATAPVPDPNTSPLPIGTATAPARPSINPFKSGTVSESLGGGAGSLGGVAGSLGNSPGLASRRQAPMSSKPFPPAQFPPSPSASTRGPPSPSLRGPSSPLPSPSLRAAPSPPGSRPASPLDRERRVSELGAPEARPVATRKRYSSSFGHRYEAAGSVGSGRGVGVPSSFGSGRPGSIGSGQPGSAGSGLGRAGSTGSGPGRPGSYSSGPGPSRPGSVGSAAQVPPAQPPPPPPPGSSFLSTATDDDDISAFVQDIDRRKPLQARPPPARGAGGEEERDKRSPPKRNPLREERTITQDDIQRSSPDTRPPPTHRRSLTAQAPRTQQPDEGPDMARSPPGRVLATADEVDERLRAMSDQFAESLRGLGTRRRPVPAGSGGTSAGGSGPGSSTASRLVDEGGAGSQGSEEVIGRLELEGQGDGAGSGALGFRRGGARPR